jgi:hypothetical protein
LAHRRKTRFRKLFCALREQNRSLQCAARTGVTAALFLAAWCALRKQNYFLHRATRAANEQLNVCISPIC